MKYTKGKRESLLGEIYWGNGKTYGCNSYWNDDASFAMDIGDGELVDKEGNPYFIHCEYNCNNRQWDFVVEIWFDNDNICSIYDIPESERSEYLSEVEISELRDIICNCSKEKNTQKPEKMDSGVKRDWIIAIANTEADGVEIFRFFGTEESVRKKMVELVEEDKENDEEGFVNGTECSEEVSIGKSNGRFELNAYATYGDYHIDYTAVTLDSIPNA